MLDEQDPAFLSELIAILVKGMGGEVMLTNQTQIGPHDLSFINGEDSNGEKYLTLRVIEHVQTALN